MKNLELILLGLMVIFAMAFLIAIYEVVNKKHVPSEWVFMIIAVVYIAIHIFNNWK